MIVGLGVMVREFDFQIYAPKKEKPMVKVFCSCCGQELDAYELNIQDFTVKQLDYGVYCSVLCRESDELQIKMQNRIIEECLED